MTLADEINHEILDLWDAPEHGLASKQPPMPLLYPELTGGGLVFVGLNPSFSDKAFRQFLRGDEWSGFEPEPFYAWRDRVEDFDASRARQIERIALDQYSYYAPFRALAEGLSTKWNHADVFLLRETSQKALLPQMLRGGVGKAAVSNLNSFGKAQLDLCVRLLGRLAPELLVVANADASRLLAEALAARFDEDLGHHVVRIGEREVPAFFSSMWTGQRALDTFSKARLLWQIRCVYRERAALTVRRT